MPQQPLRLIPHPLSSAPLLSPKQILPLDMDLASVKYFVWKRSDDLQLRFRRRTQPLASAADGASVASADSGTHSNGRRRGRHRDKDK